MKSLGLKYCQVVNEYWSFKHISKPAFVWGIRDGQTPEEARRIRPKPPKTYRNPIFVAKEYARMLKSGDAKNESDLARKVGISRVRIWQYTSLLGLNTPLVKAIEALGDPMPKVIL